MKKLKIQKQRDVLSLITGVTFSNVSSWYDASRRDLKMDLIVPKVRQGIKPRPTILWICGGAFQVVDRSTWLPQMLPFAEAGFNIASIEYRTTNEAPFPAQIVDAKAAVRYLRAHAAEFCIDPDRIYSMGESAGGTLACLLGTTGGIAEFDQGDHLNYSSSVQGVVDFYGLVDIVHCPLSQSPAVPNWTIDALLGAGYSQEAAQKASAVCYVNENTVPHLILHGEQDPLVALSQSTTLYDALCRHHVPAELIVLEGASHGDDLFYQKEVVSYIIDFLKKLA